MIVIKMIVIKMIVIKMIVIKMCRVPNSVMTTYTGCEEAGARSDTDIIIIIIIMSQTA